MLLSIIIPVLNEAHTIGATVAVLDSLQGNYEIIVVDGGSTDETVAVVQQRGLHLLRSVRGRGQQMNVGARASQGEALLFLHADTRMPEDALQQIEAALQAGEVCGGNFSLRFDGKTAGARVLTCIYPLLKLLGLLYGDSAIFVRRSAFNAIGGYRDIPLFEDCDLYQRIRREGKFVRLPAVATTSSRRFEGRFIRTFAKWTMMQILYWIGVSPHRLAQLYKSVLAAAALDICLL